MKKRESDFQSDLVKTLKDIFPGCFVAKNDASVLQGIPDLLILHQDKWAMLECKRSKKSPKRPNQEYWVDHFNEMSFAKFIYPENREEVLNDLRSLFGT